jgi:hypothetical protein
MRIFPLCLFISFYLSGSSYGQLAALKDTMYDNVPEYPLTLYKAATRDAQNLYNGRLYYIYDAHEEEHQFYEDRKFEKGTVFYDGQRYDSIPLMYDLVKDELVIKHVNGFEALLLQSPKVGFFTTHNHVFLKQESGKDINPDMRTGFYDLVYNGKSKTLVRRIKQRQEKIVEKKVIALFPAKNFYYVYANGRYNPVHTRKAVLALFPAQKTELKRSLREQKIKFRKNREMAIMAIVARYDELTKQ